MDLPNAPTVAEQVIPSRNNNTLAQLGASASSSSFQDAGSAVAFHSVAKMAVKRIIADSVIAKFYHFLYYFRNYIKSNQKIFYCAIVDMIDLLGAFAI